MRIAPLFLAAFCCGLLPAADWLTDAANPRRINWQQNESILTAAHAKDIRLLWKVKLDNEPRQMHSLFPPLIIEKLRTSSGVRQVAIHAGVSDNIYAIDVADGKLL
ncbi:MAG TPA: hypothetical protein VG273_04320 [Bryobacteraceae bacterium]|nr:hypothetical protein [Bryobacteraceae bacterium]